MAEKKGRLLPDTDLLLLNNHGTKTFIRAVIINSPGKTPLDFDNNVKIYPEKPVDPRNIFGIVSRPVRGVIGVSEELSRTAYGNGLKRFSLIELPGDSDK